MRKLIAIILIPCALHALEREDSEQNVTPNTSTAQPLEKSGLSTSSSSAGPATREQEPRFDDTPDSPISPDQSSNTALKRISSREILENFAAMCRAVTPDQFGTLYRKAPNTLEELDDYAQTAERLGKLKTTGLVVGGLAATATGIPIVRTMRSPKRFLPALIPSASTATLYGAGIGLAALLYGAQSLYTWGKLRWRDLKIQRLTDALTAMETLKNAQEVQERHIAQLEKDYTGAQKETADLQENLRKITTVQQQLLTFIDEIKIKQEEKDTQLRKDFDQDLSESKHAVCDDLGLLKASNVRISQQMDQFNAIIAKIQESLQKIAQASKKK